MYALDLTKPGAPLKWSYSPQPAAAAQGVACCDVVNRGAAWYNGRIYYNTLDAQTVCVDANTGKEVWKTKLGDINAGESITMAPIVVKGVVLVGVSGGEFGVRGWLAGVDAATGKLRWRAYHTGPDRDVLIGPSFKAFYPQDQGKDPGMKSWPGELWKIGGDPQRGAAAILRYGCGSCHTIAKLRYAHGLVGPPLTNMSSRMYIAGMLPNTPDNIVRWIRNPQAISERTAMPNLGVTSQDATDIAAYLYSY
ncbi:MAG TPA: PQQ-binding-like beta-propeller repeat protein [Bryobacteraceae bacterium]|nr:PQQ-binding-like beta-propeller repeat protein [Bryobacteraceae bacterium]